MKRQTYSLALAGLFCAVGCSHWSPIVGSWSREGLKPGEGYFLTFGKDGNYTCGGYIGGADIDGGGAYTLTGGDLTLDNPYSKPTIEPMRWLGPNEIEIDFAGSPVRYKRS